MGMSINIGKTQYMLAISRDVKNELVAGNYISEVIKDFIYVGTAIESNIDANLDTQ